MSICETKPQAGEARSIELPCGKRAPSEARRWLGWIDAYLDPRRFYDAQVMVSELVSNAVMHAELDAGDPICLRARVESDRILVTVCDRGRGFEPQNPPRRPTSDVVGGLGLWLVDTLADGLTFDGAKGRVSFEVARAGGPRPAGSAARLSGGPGRP
jgi:anti-sigma regulatory factor (Ser/Thr protein kinase)